VDVDPLKANLFEQLQALIKKELICFWRDPLLKVRIFQSLFYIVIFVVFPSFAGSGTDGSRGGFYVQYAPFVSAAVVFLFMLTLSLNTLGIERQSLTALFLFPIDRKRLLWGKNLAVFLLGFVELVALMFVCILLARSPGMILPAVVIGLAGMGVALGCGNMASVFFPRYQPAMGRRGFAGTGNQAQAGGCLNNLMSLVALVATVLLLAPVALGIGIPFFTGAQWTWVVSMPLSIVYGLVLYVLFTNIAARRMLATEPEILAVTTRE
jgi:MFS family permease